MITVEDGSNVPNANSYVTVAEFVAYAAERGVLIPVDAAQQEILLIKAMDYLESFHTRYYGVPSWTDQALAFPRYYNYADTGIPTALKKAQMVLAIAAQTVELFPTTSGTTRSAKRQTVGPITIEYSESSISGRPDIPQAMVLLRPFFGGGAGQLPVVRA